MKFILYLLPWFLSSLVPFNTKFYQNLDKPFFTPPGFIFAIVWPILYFLLALSINKVYKNYKISETKNYNISLIVNYLFNQMYPVVFFLFENIFLGFVFTLGTLISSIFLYDNTKNLNEDGTKYLIPYIIWNIFATILSLTIYFMNF